MTLDPFNGQLNATVIAQHRQTLIANAKPGRIRNEGTAMSIIPISIIARQQWSVTSRTPAVASRDFRKTLLEHSVRNMAGIWMTFCITTRKSSTRSFDSISLFRDGEVLHSPSICAGTKLTWRAFSVCR